MSSRAVSYDFHPVTACVMCGGESSRVLGRRLNGHQGLRPRQRIGIATTIVRCSGCGLIYANPQPVPKSVTDHYGRLPEEYWREDYFEMASGHFEDEIKTFTRLWDRNTKPRALDVGAGIGKSMSVLADHGFDVYGCEPSPTFHERALARGIPADRLQLAALETADLPDHGFDFIAFAAVLEHVYDPAETLRCALRFLAPRGLIHVEVPSASWLVGRGLNLLYRAQGLDYVTNLSPMHPPYHLYEFTPESFRRHSQRAGYEVRLARILSYSPTFLPRPLERGLTVLMNATGTNMQLQVWLEAKATEEHGTAGSSRGRAGTAWPPEPAPGGSPAPTSRLMG